MIDLDGGIYRAGFHEGYVEGCAEALNRVVNALKKLGASPDLIARIINLCKADNDKTTQN